MQVKEFLKQLAKKANGAGARWLKTDFHVHMPGSSDYEYGEIDATSLLGGQLTELGYDVAVVLKHQEFPSPAELEALQAEAPNTALLPGAEINVFVDTMSAKVGKDHFFHAIVIADPDDPSGYGFGLEKAKKALNYATHDYPSGFKSSIVDVGRMLRDEGALFIPAHLHQGKKPHKSRSIDDIYNDDAFLGFIREAAFNALEVRDLATASFFDGAHATVDGTPIPQAVCVASSDAHHHDHLGARGRATWLRAENPSFAEVKAALSFPHRVRLKEPQISHPRVVGLHVVGTFIPDLWVELNEGLNALIGGKGSGKTALLECLRFVLNTPVPDERRDSVRRHVEHVLGPAGYVECLVRAEGGEYNLITRRADSPDRITMIDTAGTPTSVPADAQLPFPIAILGWHEIEAVADRPSARVELLDRIGDRAAIQNLYSKIDGVIVGAREEIPFLQGHMRRLAARLKDLWDLRAKRDALTALEAGQVLDLHDQYEWFLSAEERLQSLVSASASATASLEDRVRTGLEFDHGEIPDAAAGAHASLEALSGQLSTLVSEEASAASSLENAVGEVQKAAEGALQSVRAEFVHFREDVYGPQVEALSPEERDVLARRIQVLEETRRLPTVESECAELVANVRKVAETLRAHCDSVIAYREQIALARHTLIEQLNEELDDVQLEFLPDSVTAKRDSFRDRHGDTAVEIVSYLGEMSTGGPYRGLRELFGRLEQLSVEEKKFEFRDLLWDVKFVDIFDVLDEDDVQISLSVGSAGFVPMPNLSAGQRSVAVFPLLLRNERGPLIIDQPEDNLDNRYIAGTIAPDLVDRKESQQFLVTSHNANLVVLTDADQIVHMDSDGTTCRVPNIGFLSCESSTVRQAVLDVLDGGAEALNARQMKYGIGASVDAAT